MGIREMFSKTLILKPTNTEYKISDHFPPLTWGKAGVALSGGLESTLIARIAMDVYGPENVVLLYSDNMFTQGDPESNVNVNVNVTNAAKILNHAVEYWPVDHNLHETDKFTSRTNMEQGIKDKFNVEFTFWGFTKLFFDVAEFKEDANSTHSSILEKCYSDPVKYRSVIEEFHLPSGTFSEYVKDLAIPGDVYPMLRNSPGVLRPFDILNKSEVLDLYQQLGYSDLAQLTHSCVVDTIRTNHTHCGKCFNCQQRYDAFAKLGMEDLTVYESNDVKANWIALQEKLQAQH
jgi:7-cyano-7-deazaguanine synthase in queuosine biosynthesis